MESKGDTEAKRSQARAAADAGPEELEEKKGALPPQDDAAAAAPVSGQPPGRAPPALYDGNRSC
jgi:hypothetical protein